jgi:Uncharacterized protein conserved in bacteria (DUF2252)
MTRIPPLPADAYSPLADEDTRLLVSATRTTTTTTSGSSVARGITARGVCSVCRRNKRHILLYVGSVLMVVFGGLTILSTGSNSDLSLVLSKNISMLGKHKKNKKQPQKQHAADDKKRTVNDDSIFETGHSQNKNNATLSHHPKAEKRCDWVIAQFQQRDAEKSTDELRQQYASQDGSVNIFYRATANIFWRDFKDKGWGNFLIAALDKVSLAGGVPIVHKNTWTWVTGDQHLSNFGAWQNRAGEVVFGGTCSLASHLSINF